MSAGEQMDTKVKEEYVRRKFNSETGNALDNFDYPIASKYIAQKIILEQLGEQHKNRLEIVKESLETGHFLDLNSDYYTKKNEEKKLAEHKFFKNMFRLESKLSPYYIQDFLKEMAIYLKQPLPPGEILKVPRQVTKDFLEALSVLEEWDFERKEYLTLRLADESIKDKSKSEDEKEKFMINMTF